MPSKASPLSQENKMVTPFQERVYALLLQIPSGRIVSYSTLAKALGSSPRAVGGALRANPFSPEVPCHRCVAASGYIGGFKGEWVKGEGGIGQTEKKQLLEAEGVFFDSKGMLVDSRLWWDGFSDGK